MYLTFYNLQEKPFEISPDPRFLYLSESHQEALARLSYAIQTRKGFLLLTGDVGTGKTTLINALHQQLNGSTLTITVSNPKLTVPDLYRTLYVGLEFRASYKTRLKFLEDVLECLKQKLANGNNAVLIVDEAQALSKHVLEEVRLLSNLETPEQKLLNIFLVGQLELRETLKAPDMRALSQRISIQAHIEPLDMEDTVAYIRKRLAVAGGDGANLFTTKALKLIHRYTQGYPRVINILCDNALISGFVKGLDVIDHGVIRESAGDLGIVAGNRFQQECWPPNTTRRARLFRWWGRWVH
jgi:general secretion pathway protein A